MYLFIKVQHLTDGTEVPSMVQYETDAEWRSAYHTEMGYAIAAEDVQGIDVNVMDLHLNSLFSDRYMKPLPEPEPEPEPEVEPADEVTEG